MNMSANIQITSCILIKSHIFYISYMYRKLLRESICAYLLMNFGKREGFTGL